MTIRWHTPAQGEVDHELLWGPLLALCGTLGVLWLLAGQPRSELLACTLKHWTGMPCPTCGMTRAFDALLARDVLSALRLHPLAPVLALTAVAYVPYALVTTAFGLPRLRLTPSDDEARAVRRIVALVVVAVWAFLIVDGR